MDFFNTKKDPSPIIANNATRGGRFIIGQFIDQPVAIEKRVGLVLIEMEEGFKVDVNELRNLKRSYESILSSLKREIQEELGKAIRVNSNKELGDLLFHNFGLPSLRRTPTGNPSVSIDVLERLSDSYSDVYPLLKSVIEFKNVQALIKALKIISKKLDPSGRIRPEFNQSTCPTGRIYSYIQNLPKQVRKVLTPDKEENVFIELDWSQQELRILAALAQEPVLLDCFARNEDPHRIVISEMFHKPVSEVGDEERRTGKTINYGLIFGQEAPGLAWTLNISIEKAQGLIDRYFSSLPMILKFKYDSRESFLAKGFAETPFGRTSRLNLHGLNRERELRRGFNHIIQGTGADILRMTLVRLHDALTDKPAKLKFCAHDSIYLETPKEASEEIGNLARSIMEIDFKGVELPATIKIHTDFSMGEG